MLFRSFVGFKPSKHSHSSERSEESDKAAFVAQWGGSVTPITGLPPEMRIALLEVAKLEADKVREGKNA